MDKKKVKCMVRNHLKGIGLKYGRIFAFGTGFQFTDINGDPNIYQLNKKLKGMATVEKLGNSICVI